MKATTQNTNTQNSLTSTRLVVLFAMLLLSSLGMFGQNVQSTNIVSTTTFSVAASDDAIATAQNVTTTNTSMNMVSWFMGTKQTPNANQAQDVSSNSKKQMINSGIAPNRLLIKVFMKKATNYNSTIA